MDMKELMFMKLFKMSVLYTRYFSIVYNLHNGVCRSTSLSVVQVNV
jgi:hypothetical protein